MQCNVQILMMMMSVTARFCVIRWRDTIGTVDGGTSRRARFVQTSAAKTRKQSRHQLTAGLSLKLGGVSRTAAASRAIIPNPKVIYFEFN
jgi:hypothetical protein